MRLKLLVFLLLATALFACQNRAAFKYSEAIVSIEQSMAPDMNKAEEELADLLTQNDFDSVAIVAGQMENLADRKLKEVEQLKVPDAKDAALFRRASIRFFTYIKNLYAGYRQYAQQTNEEDREVERKRLLRIMDDKNNAIENMQRAQRRYAEANGFRIK